MLWIKLILEIKPSEYSEDTINDEGKDATANFFSHEKLSNDIEIDKIFKKIEQFASRVRPVLEEKINKISAELFSSKEGTVCDLLKKKKVKLEKLLSLLIEYSEPDAKHQYGIQEHKAHLEELARKEPEMIG